MRAIIFGSVQVMIDGQFAAPLAVKMLKLKDGDFIPHLSCLVVSCREAAAGRNAREADAVSCEITGLGWFCRCGADGAPQLLWGRFDVNESRPWITGKY